MINKVDISYICKYVYNLYGITLGFMSLNLIIDRGKMMLMLFHIYRVIFLYNSPMPSIPQVQVVMLMNL